MEKRRLQLGLLISRQNQHFLELGHGASKKRVPCGGMERQRSLAGADGQGDGVIAEGKNSTFLDAIGMYDYTRKKKPGILRQLDMFNLHGVEVST